MKEKDNLNEKYESFYEDDEFRDGLATVSKTGKRIWIFPKMPKGSFYTKRKLVSYFLLVILFGLPWLKNNGQPMFLFNVVDSKFILFGTYFPPQDFYLFVIAMLIGIVGIVLFTVIFGRVFCGWICPQTIFMEMVYRRIEYWLEGDANAQKRLNKSAWNTNKLWRKGLKHFLFFCIAILIANTFLAYIIGIDEVINIIKDPINLHMSGFLAMIIFSIVFYLVFAFLREQVCTTICPYGRLQGVMLDDKSLAVSYDYIRGEPRTKLKKKNDAPSGGDCIDCKLCIKVCPTGIDIRNGIQLECVNCTACIDACDEVMDKIDKPQGLIRIDSLEGIKTGKRSIINKRSIAYSSVLIILIILEGFLMFSRSEMDALILRTPGSLYYEKVPGEISNMYKYTLLNKTSELMDIQFKALNIDAEIEFIGGTPVAKIQESVEGTILIQIDAKNLKERKTKLEIGVYSDDKLIDKVKTTFFAPVK